MTGEFEKFDSWVPKRTHFNLRLLLYEQELHYNEHNYVFTLKVSILPRSRRRTRSHELFDLWRFPTQCNGTLHQKRERHKINACTLKMRK